ncbi:MAG: hypothetical protein OXI63_00350, partial [Candidatus Poribacteria bacterium]|nr:hypothetical protein [Candidatus Poribacteria bacterium]
DPLYNQSKLYSELFRLLGWIHPLGRKLKFQFTYFGAHVVAAKLNPLAILEESVLGIAYPNDILNVKGNYQLRLFATFLRTLGALGGLLARDELIIGPMCLDDDRDDQLFNNMVREIQNLRGSWRALDEKMKAVASQRGIKRDTMVNYTRVVLPMLREIGWTTDENNEILYNKSIKFNKLTAKGYKALELINESKDIRKIDLEKIDKATKDAIIRLSFYQILGRAGFDTVPVESMLIEDQVLVENYLGSANYPILFSPFQELHSDYLYSIFPNLSGREASKTPIELRFSSARGGTAETRYSSVELISETGPLIEELASGSQDVDGETLDVFKETIERGWDLGTSIEYIMSQYADANKDIFYPIVEKLFKAIGYDCELSRTGVNYKRWDAMIRSPKHSMPIEIKSPGEEKFLSVKAIRQALENKVILLARAASATEFEDASLVVCYNLPNDRSEVNSLINDVFEVYGIVIGVIDFRTLLQIAGSHLLLKKEHNRNQLEKLRGFIRLSDP